MNETNLISGRSVDPYWEKFEEFTAQPSSEPGWLLPLRKAAMARFAERGFPTVQEEEWRFTNMGPVARLPFRPAEMSPRPSRTVLPGGLAGFCFAQLKMSRLVFIDGQYAPHFSKAAPATGAHVRSLASVLAEGGAAVEGHLGQYIESTLNPFVALNTAFFRDGAVISVPAGVSLPDPVHLLFISTCPEAGAAVHPRNILLAGEGSKFTVIESYVSTHDAPGVTNSVTELVLGAQAQVEHCKFQDESTESFHLGALHAQLGRNASLISHSIATGSRLARNNIYTHLAAERGKCILNGLYLTQGEQLIDHYMVVEHAKPHCQSHEYYTGILDDRSRGVFHGRILVRPDAQKTDAKQTNKNLLLSDEATINTKPQLEIYADDVKCTHGATVGQLDDESIFYLRSRGIGLETARRMLMHAFAGEIIDRIQFEPVRNELDKLIWDRLEQRPKIGAAH